MAKIKSPQQSMTDKSASPAPSGDAENNPIITHSEKKAIPFAEILQKAFEKNVLLDHSRTGNVVLCVVVDQNKIPLSSLTATKKDRGRQSASLANADSSNSRPVTYSIAQIIKFVNSGDLLRYIPDEMSTQGQILKIL